LPAGAAPWEKKEFVAIDFPAGFGLTQQFAKMRVADMSIALPSPRRRLQAAARNSLMTLLATTALGVVSAHAVDGTWTGPGTDWVDGTNWSSNPDVPNGRATFTNNAAPTTLNNGGFVAIGAVQFVAGAPSYTIGVDNAFLVTGTGIFNDSVNPQTFNVSDNLIFQNGSSAAAAPAPSTSTTPV
jgi:hypothetical protein